MRIALFEDAKSEQMLPLAAMRPVFELVCGRSSVRERLIRHLDVTEWGVFVRPWLAEVYREEQPESHVNTTEWLKAGVTVFVNGRWLPTPRDLKRLAAVESGSVGVHEAQLAWIVVRSEEAELFDVGELDDSLRVLARNARAVTVEGTVVEYPWDLVDRNADQLSADFRLLELDREQHVLLPNEIFRPRARLSPEIAVLGEPAQVYVDRLAEIEPHVVLDARGGPIVISAGARVQAFSRIEGPCHVGHRAVILGAKIRGGTTIGPNCRVGGEVETSILHGCVNKYHDGFLGHSYVCPWANLGALTTNSDLKNDYSEVSVPLTGEMIASGQRKVGCFIGDHVKTALGSLFNTGTSVGVMATIVPGGELLPKHVPPFGRVLYGQLDGEVGLSDAMATARSAMERRGAELTDAQMRLLTDLFRRSYAERSEAIGRFRERMRRRSERMLTNRQEI